MSPRFSDFLFSTGLMVVGVVILLLGSVVNVTAQVSSLIAPAAAPQPAPAAPAAPAGGDPVPSVAPVSKPIIPLPKDKIAFDGTLTASGALIVDDRSSAVLYEKNSAAPRPLASLTKLMSALVLNDLPIDWASTTVVNAEDVDSSGHQINGGEKYALNDLWHIALVASSNSAIRTLVRASGLTTRQFVGKMNWKARALNLPSLHFVEPTGLDVNNVGAAWDILRLLKEAIKVDKIKSTLQLQQYEARPIGSDQPRRLWSTDLLLTHWVPSNFSTDDIIGKTGYTTEAGYNFTTRISDGKGHAVRVIILGAASSDARFSEARDLAAWAFGEYVWPDQEGYDKLAPK